MEGWRGALEERWQRVLASNADPVAVAESFHDLVARYSAPDRFYHDLHHIAFVLRTLDQLLPTLPVALEWAAWFHDVIYDPFATDNEDRSADFAASIAARLGLSEAVRDEAARLILLTRSHHCDSSDLVGQTLLDADLAILGASPADYDRYVEGVRKEYARVAEADWRIGRSRVMAGFLSRPRIYHTEVMLRRAEQSARDNIRRELAALGGLPDAS